jgi:hypothetical protein
MSSEGIPWERLSNNEAIFLFEYVKQHGLLTAWCLLIPPE